MTAVIEFRAYGRPAAQGSKAFKGMRAGRAILVEQSKNVGPWRRHIAVMAHNAMQGQPPLTGPMRVHIRFVLPRPKATPKTRATPPAVKKPDLDKLSRAVLDAMTGVVFVDDAQVVYLAAYKRIAEIGERSGATIQIEAA